MSIQPHRYATDDDQPLAQVIPLFRNTHPDDMAYPDDDQGLILRFGDDYLDGQGAS